MTDSPTANSRPPGRPRPPGRAACRRHVNRGISGVWRRPRVRSRCRFRHKGAKINMFALFKNIFGTYI
jgi:hypothetical protein